MSSPYKIKTGVRIPELDGLRGLAIFMVVLSHYVPNDIWSGDSTLSAIMHSAFSLNWSGVDLFFVLSGFLIGGILMDQRETTNYFRTFYLRRICRIFPLYYLWLALCFILPGLFLFFHPQKWFEPIFAQDVSRWYSIFFAQNIYSARTEALTSSWLLVTWSLAVEEQFYLLLPLVIWLVPAKKLPKVLVPLILFAPLFRLYLYFYDFRSSASTLELLPCRADALLMGVLCAYGMRHETLRRCLENNQKRLYQAFVVLLAGAGYLAVSFRGINSFDREFWGFHGWRCCMPVCC